MCTIHSEIIVSKTHYQQLYQFSIVPTAVKLKKYWHFPMTKLRNIYCDVADKQNKVH